MDIVIGGLYLLAAIFFTLGLKGTFLILALQSGVI